MKSEELKVKSEELKVKSEEWIVDREHFGALRRTSAHFGGLSVKAQCKKLRMWNLELFPQRRIDRFTTLLPSAVLVN